MKWGLPEGISRRAPLVVLVMATMLATGVALAREAQADRADSHFVLPKSIGPLELVEEHTFDDARLGRAYSYRAPGFSLDIYIYPGEAAPEADGIVTAAARDEFEAAKTTVLSTKAYSRRALTGESTTTAGRDDAALPALEAVFDLSLEDVELRSYLWLTAADGYFVKARFSLLRELTLEADSARAEVLAELGALIASAPSGTAPSVAATDRS
jgi:hypothetical protein